MAEGEYDFIIVGGGTAGLVVANRLTEDPETRVLVIEAGADRLTDPKITIPGLATTLYDDPQYDWTFSTAPQVRKTLLMVLGTCELSSNPLTSSFIVNRSIYTESESAMDEERF
jgi:choline dehydrogenase-like flavoprotein